MPVRELNNIMASLVWSLFMVNSCRWEMRQSISTCFFRVGCYEQFFIPSLVLRNGVDSEESSEDKINNGCPKGEGVPGVCQMIQCYKLDCINGRPDPLAESSPTSVWVLGNFIFTDFL